jgi:hypothetical protein
MAQQWIHIFPGYTSLYTVALNLAVGVVLTPVFDTRRSRHAAIVATVPADY